MNKKAQKEKKQTNNIRKYLLKDSSTEQKSCPPTAAKNEGKKKICTSLNEFFNCKEKTPSPPPTPKKMQLHSILKPVSIEEILEKCPKLQQLVTIFVSKTGLSKHNVQMILKKYVQSHPNSLWSSKYAPVEISQLFSISTAQKIMDWLNAFFEYKNKISEQDSFINEASEQRSCKVYKNIKENQWQLMALIVRGRPGIGKTAAIRAVAHEMDIDLHECGNDYNQTKYLKQKNESTQSESVKTAYSRKPKIQKNAQMITKFLPPIQKQKAMESKKGQMIHNISIVYPQSQSQKFYNQLSRCVQLSKIPFIMTNSGEKLPQVCQKYDIIEYQIEENQKIDKILWIIEHLQNLNFINTTVCIQKQEVFQQINRQIENIQFQELCKLSSIHEICLLFNYRLDYILTFLQYHKNDLNEINTLPLLISKYKNYNEDQLLQEILFIDFQKLNRGTPVKPKRLKKQDILCVSQESTESEKNRQIIEESHNEATLDSKQNPKKMFEHIKLLAIEDTISSKKSEMPFAKNSYDSSQWQNHPYTCIQIGIHEGIKKSLVKMANNEIEVLMERTKSTLKMEQLCYLPMLLKQKRANRTSRIALEGLKKIYDQHELCYLEHFGNLIRQQ